MSERVPEADPNGYRAGQNAAARANRGIITSVTVVPVNTDRPYASQQLYAQQGDMNEVVKSYRAATPALRKALAAKLKAAGYKVPITGEYDISVMDAFVDSYKEFTEFAGRIMSADPEFFTTTPFQHSDFLDIQASGAAGTGTKSYATIYSEEKAGVLVDKIFRDLTGMPASEEDKLKYSAILRQEQASAPTTYNAETGTTVAGMGAEESQQLLIDQIAKTDEAKRMRGMDGYRTILSELGVTL